MLGINNAVAVILAFLCVGFLGPPSAPAQTSGAIDVTLTGKNMTRRLYSRSFALVIGINRYTNGWPPLVQAVDDAQKVAAVLKKLGFKVTLLVTSNGNQLTASELRKALRDFLIKGPNSHPNSRLLIWFAGHGHTMRIP